MVDPADKFAKVEPNDPATWTGLALVTPIPAGNSTGLPVASVEAGPQTISRYDVATRNGKAVVNGLPASEWIVLRLLETNGPIVTINVGTDPYVDGVVVLFV